MRAERLLQIHIVLLCVLGAMFISLNTGDARVPLTVLLTGAISVVVTDAWKVLQLHRFLGNMAAVGAVVFALWNFLEGESNVQLRAIANLLVYLEVILFFQEKNVRLYWQIILLSLLQVVVGAALNLGLAFGGLLLVYTGLSISTLVVFFAYREVAEQEEGVTKPIVARVKSKWGALLGKPATVKNSTPISQLDRNLMSPALAWQTFLFTLGALVFGVVFFYSAPRHRQVAWSGSKSFTSSETGVSREMELQQMGELLQSDAPVMRVELLNHKGENLSRFEPYFAGEVLTHYLNDGTHARWVVTSITNPDLQREGEVLPLIEPTKSVTIQRIEMQPTPYQTLFTIGPTYRLRSTPAYVRRDPTTNQAMRAADADTLPVQSLEFEVATTGVIGSDQPRLIPRSPRNDVSESGECRQFEERQFPKLKALADDILKRKGLTATDSNYRRAKALQDHFLEPGLYTYSLNLNLPRQKGVDPIENFVANHRTGHCQYFASALVMMLRSQKIPARMVVGYRGDEYNQVSRQYVVLQRHAHAWVEAYLPFDQLPVGEPGASEIGPHGAWLRLEPTPGGDAVAAGRDATWMGRARDWLDHIDSLWSNYVIGLNQERQNQSVFGTIQPSSEEDNLFSGADWSEALRNLAGWFGFHFSESGVGVKFDWRAAASSMGFCFLVVVGIRVLRWLGAKLGWWRQFSRLGNRRKVSPVEFYARLEAIISRRGRPRRLSETPREFIEHALKELSLPGADALRGLIESFYRVRFGGVTLDESELQLIGHTLTQLEQTGRTQVA